MPQQPGAVPAPDLWHLPAYDVLEESCQMCSAEEGEAGGGEGAEDTAGGSIGGVVTFLWIRDCPSRWNVVI